MNKKTIYKDSRLTVVNGFDNTSGMFYQLFDKQMGKKTPEGLVLDWSSISGFKVNITGYDNVLGLIGIIEKYLLHNHKGKAEFRYDFK